MLILSNPITQQTVRASRWPSPIVTLGLSGGLWITSFSIRGWLFRQLPNWFNTFQAILLVFVWLTPLMIMAICAASTARRMHEQSFKMLKQSTHSDAQVVWGYGLSMLYRLRLGLVLVLVSLPLLGDDTLLGGITQMVFLAGLHLLGAIMTPRN